MGDIGAAFGQALHLLATGEGGVWHIVARSLFVSGVSVAIGCLIGIPIGAVVGLRRFTGRRLAVASLNLGLGLPPVVVGLFVYLLLSRSGPLGFMRLLYSPSARSDSPDSLASSYHGPILGHHRPCFPLRSRLRSMRLHLDTFLGARPL